MRLAHGGSFPVFGCMKFSRWLRAGRHGIGAGYPAPGASAVLTSHHTPTSQAFQRLGAAFCFTGAMLAGPVRIEDRYST